MRKGYKQEYTQEYKKRPLYYNEYCVNVNEDKDKYTSCLTFLILTTVFVFFPSISDIIYSYMEIDKCQEMNYMITLNNWYRFLGVYSLIYYTFIFMSIYFFYIKNSDETYSRLYNKSERVDKETNTYFFKIFSSIFTVFLLVIQSIVFYAYFGYFNHYCTSLVIIIYMWIRLLVGILSSIFIIIFVNVYIE